MQPTPLRLKWLDGVLQAYERKYGERLPADVWNIHVWILPERANAWGAGIPVGLRAQAGELYSWRDCADPSVFAHLVRQFRIWMQSKGEQNKPLIVQYGVSQPVSYVGDGDPDLGTERIKMFMLETFDFLLSARDAQIGLPQDDYRLVQRWLWRSLNEPPYDFATGKGVDGALFKCDDPTALTALGRAFDEYMRSLSE
jgi:hypothetical protein